TDCDVETGFLFHLPHRRLLQHLTGLAHPTRERPIAVILHEQHLLSRIVQDEDIGHVHAFSLHWYLLPDHAGALWEQCSRQGADAAIRLQADGAETVIELLVRGGGCGCAGCRLLRHGNQVWSDRAPIYGWLKGSA